MRRRLLTCLVIASITRISVAEKHGPNCKPLSDAFSCSSIHGRLAIYDGGAPNFRLWHIGTNHIYGIFTDKHDMNCTCAIIQCSRQDEENPDLPRSLAKAYDVANPFSVTIYADFEVCPLEPRIHGHMQAACIESATHLVVKKD